MMLVSAFAHAKITLPAVRPSLSLAFTIRGPEGQVVTEELHDEGGVLVRLLGNIVEVANGALEGVLCHVAGFLWLLHDFVLEDRVVQNQAKANWVCGCKIGSGNFQGLAIGCIGILGSSILGGTNAELSNVAVVVSLHLLVEDLSIRIIGSCNELAIKETDDLIADLGQLSLDSGLVLLSPTCILSVALACLLVLDARDDSPCSTTTSDSILVGDRQEVALFHGEFLANVANLLHLVSHLIIPLSLLGKLGKVDCLGLVCHCV